MEFSYDISADSNRGARRDAYEIQEIAADKETAALLVSRERRESPLEEDDRSGMSGVKFAQYAGIKYSTLAYWLQSLRRHRERERSLIKSGADTEADQQRR
jgi:hypothetical protein